MAKIRLLVELGGLKTERVDNVVDLDSSVLNALVGLLSGSVGADVYLIPSVIWQQIKHQQRAAKVYAPISTAPRVIIWQSTS